VRVRPQLWQVVSLLSLLCALSILAVHFFRVSAGASPADLVSYLPTANATVVYVDVDAIRRSGILNMVAGSKTAEEPEYQQFVHDTLFDYRQDLDAVAAAFQDGQVFLALRGRFHWKNLMEYANHQGGSCHNSFCVVSGSQPNRRISFYPLQSNLMAMAIGPDDFAAYQITRHTGQPALAPRNQPVWARVPAVALKNADSLPDGAKPYVSALQQNTEQIVFSVGPEADHLQLALQVTCKDTTAASALLVNFEGATSTLRKWIAQQHPQPGPSDLTGFLVAGTFRRDQRQVYGQWPIPKAFVDAIAGASY
jgi:hypothetical protein